MFIRLQKSRRGFTILELMISLTLFALAMAVVMAVYLFSSKTFAVMANFAQLDQNNRVALDTMTKEIRGAQSVVTNSSSSLTFINEFGNSVTYLFEPNTKELVRLQGSSSQVLLTNCDLLTFNCGQRNVTNGTFDFYPPATNGPSTIKEVQLTWKAASTIPGSALAVSEDIQTAQIVLRMAGGTQQ